MKCAGCYKEGYSDFCPRCRKLLFDGANVSSILPFDAPGTWNFEVYHEKSKRLSISGVQLKYSLKLEGTTLSMTDYDGAYILKPIPPSHIVLPDQAPENEHLTMQIARQIFKIDTAANALVRFADGAPAYITKRFDRRPDGTRNLQEDFAQISQRSRQSHGPNFKYEGSYEEIGKLIRQYVAASTPALESYFKLLVFNYLFSNRDAHLKNFSLYNTGAEYKLTPAYDLMSTVLHTPLESDLALDLYEGDIFHEYYQTFGYYGKANFLELAARLGIMDNRALRIIIRLTDKPTKVEDMIANSFLTPEARSSYSRAFQDKLHRLTT